MAAACALDVLAGGGELEDPRLWSTQGAAEPASAWPPHRAPLARPLPLRAWGALPTWGSMMLFWNHCLHRALEQPCQEKPRCRNTSLDKGGASSMRCEGVLILKWMALICSVIPVIGQAVCIQLRFSLSRLCVLRVSLMGPYTRW